MDGGGEEQQGILIHFQGCIETLREESIDVKRVENSLSCFCVPNTLRVDLGTSIRNNQGP